MHCSVSINFGGKIPDWSTGRSLNAGAKTKWIEKYVDIDAKFVDLVIHISGHDLDSKGMCVGNDIGWADISLKEFIKPCSRDVDLFMKNGQGIPGGFVNIISEFIVTDITEVVDTPIPRDVRHFSVKHTIPEWKQGFLSFHVLEAKISNNVVPGRSTLTPLVRFEVTAEDEDVDWKTNRCNQGNRNPKWED